MPKIVDDSKLRPASLPTLAISQGQAVIQLNRPSHHNRIEPSDVAMLQRLLAKIDKDDAVRVLVLTGAGDTFCAGYDLLALAARKPASEGKKGAGLVDDFPELVNRIEN